MNRIKRWLPSRRWLFIPPILVGVGIFAAFVSSRKELPRLEPEETAIPLPVVNIENLYLQPRAKGYGTVQPSRTWTAIAEVSGSIVETHPALDSGKKISAGKLLVSIDDSDYKLRQSQRQAELDSAKAKLAELNASQKADEESLLIENELLAVNQAELRRMQQLYQQQATSTSEVDQAQGNVFRQIQSVQKLKNSISLYPSRIASAKASVDMAMSRLDEAKRDVERTRIVSPFDGVLVGVNLEPFQVVGKNEKLFQLQDDRLMEVEAQFSLAQLDNLAPSIPALLTESTLITNADFLAGLSAQLVVRSGNLTMRWTGKPIRIADSVNQQTRTLGVIVQVDNQTGKLAHASTSDSAVGNDRESSTVTNDELTEQFAAPQSLSTPLRAGTFCEVTLLGAPISNSISVPRTAVDGDSVYVVEKIDQQSRLRRRRVKLGFAIDDRMTIESGLVFGDQVAIKPPLPAMDGLLVSPVIVSDVSDSSDSSDASDKEPGLEAATLNDRRP